MGMAYEEMKPEVIKVENVQVVQEVVEEPREVPIRVIYDTDGIKNLIRETFKGDAETALKVAACESGFKMVQSHHMQPYGREQSFGIFQIHAPDWNAKAKELGYPDYQDDIEQNVKMAYHIFKVSGWRAWSCYSKGMI